jgi:hypothetical protein
MSHLFDGTVCSEIAWYDFFTNLIRNWISCEDTIVGNDDTVIDISQRTLQIESLESESFFRLRGMY